MVSGVGAANASAAKDNCEDDAEDNDQFQQSVRCDDYQHVADSGGATAVSTFSALFSSSCSVFPHF